MPVLDSEESSAAGQSLPGQTSSRQSKVSGVDQDLPKGLAIHDPLIHWLEKQVKSRLLVLDAKLDELAIKVDSSNVRKRGLRRSGFFLGARTSATHWTVPMRHLGSVPMPAGEPPDMASDVRGSSKESNRELRVQSKESNCALRVSQSTLHPEPVNIGEAPERSPRTPRLSQADGHRDDGGRMTRLPSLSSYCSSSPNPAWTSGVSKTLEDRGTNSSGFEPQETLPERLRAFEARRKELKRSITASQESFPLNAKMIANHRRAVVRYGKGSTLNLGAKVEAMDKLLKRDRSECFDQISTFLEDIDASPNGRLYAKAMDIFTLCTVLVTFLQTTAPPVLYGTGAAVLETCFDVVILMEITLRFIVCPSRCSFFLEVYNWVDILAGSVIILRASIGLVVSNEGHDAERIILLCLVPVLRLTRMLRHFEKIHLLMTAFRITMEALPVLLFMLLLIALSFSALIYIVEPRSNINSLPEAVWLSIVTMTTVGYGDVVPVSTSGSIVVSLLVLSSVLFMAMPLGIIGSAFNQVWMDRDRVLLMSRTRRNLHKWGYTAHDIPLLFRMVDANNDGELDLLEFRQLMMQMRIGLSDERAIQLFQSMDCNDSGTLDGREFVRHVFPSHFVEVYGHDDGSERSGSLTKASSTLTTTLRKMGLGNSSTASGDDDPLNLRMSEVEDIRQSWGPKTSYSITGSTLPEEMLTDLGSERSPRS